MALTCRFLGPNEQMCALSRPVEWPGADVRTVKPAGSVSSFAR
jgi:hypothetical protein